MLFADKRLISPYDFDQELPDEQKSIYALAKHIMEKMNEIKNIVESNKERLELYHSDNNGARLFIGEIDKSVSNRGIIEIESLLSRNDIKRTSIAGYLYEWGIIKPEKDSNDFGSYLKLLYFFYMVRYVIFPNGYIFKLLSEKHRSTDISPLSSTNNGKYLYFILNNLLDVGDAREKFMENDKYITLQIHNISKILDVLITRDNLDSKQYFDIIKDIKDDVKKEYYSESSIPQSVNDQAIDYIYRYQNLAYINEMIYTLEQDTFKFVHMNIKADEEWKGEYIGVDKTSVMDFLNQSKVRKFYTQQHKSIPRDLEKFIENLLTYDKGLLESEGECFWIESNGNRENIISKYKLAVIVKTFLDLGTNTFKQPIKVSARKWQEDHSYRKILTGTAPDIVMKYFYVAYESEMINEELEDESYESVFNPFYIRKYEIIQQIMRVAFTVNNPEERSMYLARVLIDITRKITIPMRAKGKN